MSVTPVRSDGFLLRSRLHVASIRRDLAADQGEEGPQSGSVGGGGVELDSGGKHSRLIEALKAFSLAFASLSCAISLSSSLVRRSICFVRCSISRTGRQLSIDKNERHGGSDAGDSPLLGEREASTGEGDVVIGREQSDKANDQASDGLKPAKPIKARPGAQEVGRFWRIRRLLAGAARGIGHGLWKVMPGVNSNWEALPIPPSSSATMAAVCLSTSTQAASSRPEKGPEQLEALLMRRWPQAPAPAHRSGR